MGVTFSMIKPDAFKQGLSGRILSDIEQSGFKIVKMRVVRMSRDQAMDFYNSLSHLPFYNDLCDYMSSGPIIALVLEADDAVKRFRDLIGATDPAMAMCGTIRSKYGISKGSNAIHGSDSDLSAEREVKFFDL